MRRLSMVFLVAAVSGCGDSNGPGQASWLGTWSVQPTTVAELGLRPDVGPSGSPFTATITDSAGHLRLQLPALRLDDSLNLEYTVYAAGQYLATPTGDSLQVTLNGTSHNYSFPTNLTFAGATTGSTGAGTLTLSGSAPAYSAGTWTAVKQ